MTSVIEWTMAEGSYGTPDGGIAVIHERNNFQTEAIATFDWLCAKHPTASQKWSLTFGTKEQYTPLQAADALAYEANRRLRDKSAPDRKAWSALTPPLNGRFFAYMDKGVIRDIMQKAALKKFYAGVEGRPPQLDEMTPRPRLPEARERS